ncbi:copper homeostasis protein CutC [Vibrio penaeicida]|uniref:copper homeostasis protein CutC n=1 Tax=Vibrio penaeicida TaxID=104609 RepID=UPI000CE9F876|nr:copper homeostasis protein CutC [Vibrio penaeicida]
MIKEICVENFTSIPDAIKNGANRISLKDNYLEQGTTVSKGVMKASIEYANKYKIPVVICIRPRKGNFVYSSQEIEIMQTDIQLAKELGATAIDFGCLKENNALDKNAILKILESAKGIKTVFHMAFDDIPRSEHQEAIDWLHEQGITHILSHGGPISEPIDLAYLKELVEMAKEKLTIVPGGGVNYTNAEAIANELGVSEVHGSYIVKLDNYEF